MPYFITPGFHQFSFTRSLTGNWGWEHWDGEEKEGRERKWEEREGVLCTRSRISGKTISALDEPGKLIVFNFRL